LQNRYTFVLTQNQIIMSITKEQINPQMIVLARESRGMMQKDLADKLGVSSGKLSYVENGELTLDDKELEKLSKALNYPSNFFFQQGEAYLPSSINFRRRLKVVQRLLTPVVANINIYRLNIEKLMIGLKFAQPKIPVVDMNKCGTPQEAAKKLRSYWKVPSGPIDSMTALLEENNILVLSFDFETDRVDSRTILTKGMYPLIVINKRMLGDRQRFSLAFELGHLVMHSLSLASTEQDIDHEANLFAAEFLMPEKDIRKDFEASDITLSRLGELKGKWKVSMQSLLYHACDLGFLTVNQKRYLISQFNSMKIRRREPQEFDIPIEKPLLIRNLMTKYRNAQRITINELAATFNLTQDEFMERYGN
jgi:Zn-dependent peptidase ImmA (M78 family)/DNA-binding XRE family transcriptional regulator